MITFIKLIHNIFVLNTVCVFNKREIMKNKNYKFILFIFLFIANINVLLCQNNKDECVEIKNKKSIKQYESALNYYKSGNYTDAIRVLKFLIEDEPEYPAAYYLLGMINIKKRDYDLNAAERYFSKLIEICPSYDAYPYYYLGKIMYGREDWLSAVNYFNEFINRVDKDKNDTKLDKDYAEVETLLKYASFYNKMKNNPVPFNPKQVKGICTAMDEYLAIITADNSLAFYTRRVEMPPDKTKPYLAEETKKKEMFCFSKKEGDAFTTGEIMPYPFNRFENEGAATLTINNKELFYTVCKWINSKNKSEPYYNCDICTSTFEDNYWSEIKPLGKVINTDDYWESQPSISADGKTLYFASDRPGGYGGLDIYMSQRNDKGEWLPAVNLGPVINTPGNEKSPFIHTDNQTLYFSSSDREDPQTGQYYYGHLGMGGYDIFFSKKDNNGNWGKPVNIGYPINSSADDLSFFVSTDGKTGYFSSNKLKKNQDDWDLYSFDLYKEAQPEKVLFIKGTLKDEKKDEPIQANIELKNVETKKITLIPVDSISGEYVAAVLFRNDYVMTVKKENYVYETKYISKEDTTFEKPTVVDIEMKPIEVGNSYKLNDIYFNLNSYELTEHSLFVLEGFIEFLNENPSIKIAIHGHTDDIGSEESNQKLSELRAKAVFNYLVSKGISESRMTYKGFGESKPVASNATEEGRAKNRRTEFVILSK